MRTFLEIYFGINLLVTGYMLGDWTMDKPRLILSATLVASVPIGIGWLIWELLKQYLQAEFWYAFFFTKEYSGLSNEQLARINTSIKKHHPNSIMGKMMCMKINKRNNYMKL